MIKFKRESAGHPDYMKIVGAEMDKEYNVFEFVDEILESRPKDYGRIDIDGKISYEYKNGVLDWALIPQDLFNRVVENVKGMSSYYHAVYKLILKDDARTALEDVYDTSENVCAEINGKGWIEWTKRKLKKALKKSC